MAKNVTKKATISTAYGEPVNPPLEFSYGYDELQKGDEIPADEKPDADDILTLVNQKRNAKARASAQNEALSEAGIQKPTLESPDVRLKTMVKVLVAAGNDEETATTIAKSALGM
jgi:hypothetical protein